MADAPVMSRAFLDQAVRERSSPDGDTATAQTVRRMCELIATSSRDSLVNATARLAHRTFKGGPLYKGLPNDPRAIAGSCWWLANTQLKFIHHEEMIHALWGESDQLQLLISPDVLLRTKQPAGDCAIYTMLVCSLLKSSGVPFEVVTVAVDPTQPQMFTHVYARAVLPGGGARLSLDASHGKYPGWEVPRAHTIRKQVWDENGEPIADAAAHSSRLHGYTRRGMGACGVDPSSGEAWGDCSAGTGSGSGSSWGGFIQDMAKLWSNIGANVIAPRTTIQTGPGGQYISTPGSAPSLVSPFATGTGSTNWLVWGGLAVGAVFLVSMMKGGRR